MPARAPISPPPGFLSVQRLTSAGSPRTVHLNCQKISCYGEGEVNTRWIAVAGRKKLIWTEETMEEIAGKIAKAMAG